MKSGVCSGGTTFDRLRPHTDSDTLMGGPSDRAGMSPPVPLQTASPALLVTGAVLVMVVAVVAVRSVVEIAEDERGIYLRLGHVVGVLEPGRHYVVPFVSQIPTVDVRPKTLELAQAVTLADNEQAAATATVVFEVTDPEQAFMAVEDHEDAFENLATTTLRAVVGDYATDELFENGRLDVQRRNALRTEFRAALTDPIEAWGLALVAVESFDVEPV